MLWWAHFFVLHMPCEVQQIIGRHCVTDLALVFGGILYTFSSSSRHVIPDWASETGQSPFNVSYWLVGRPWWN